MARVFLFIAEMLSRVDEMLLLMKSEIDQILNNDEKLQNFLTWVHKKSKSAEVPYKPVAIRAFYYDFSSNFLIGKFGWQKATRQYYDLARSLLPIYSFEISQRIDKSLKEAFECEFYIEHIHDRHTDLMIWEEEQKHFRELYYDPYTDLEEIKNEELESEIENLIEEYNNLENKLSPELYYDLLIADSIQISLSVSDFHFSSNLPYDFSGYPSTPIFSLSLEMKKEMENLLDSMEDLTIQAKIFSGQEYESWFKSTGYQWLRKLISIMQEHRDIGHDWEFNDTQKQLLRSHYYANQLLLDCLNSNHRVSEEARREIEDTLLLPITEIPKCHSLEIEVPRSMNQKSILRVVVASPGDVQAERDLLPAVIDELNRNIAADRNLSLELTRWETDAYPGFHSDGPQGLIDPVLKIEECNILIGIFWRRFGTPVKDANSGTEHEFLNAYEAWQQKGSPQIMVYFNQTPYSPSSSKETEQWTQVLKFKESFPEEGLWWKYKGEVDFERQVRNHLTQFIRKHHPSKAQNSTFSENSHTLSGSQPMIYNDFRGSTIGNLAHNVQGNQHST